MRPSTPSAPGRPTASKRGGRRRRTLFPPSVFPLWKPPFLIPPFSKESTKGGKPQGAPARRPLWRGRRHGASLSPCLSRPQRACRPRAAALRVAAATPPLSPRCATAPRGRARWSGRHRLSPFRASTRCRPSVERRRSSRACGCKCSPESRLHRSPYSVAAACRCRRRRRHRHAAAHDRENPGPVFPLRKRSLTLSPKAGTKTCEAVFAPAPTLRAASVLPAEPSCRNACASRAVAASPRSCRTLCFPSPEETGAWKTKLLRLSPENRPPRMPYNGRSGGGEGG